MLYAIVYNPGLLKRFITGDKTWVYAQKLRLVRSNVRFLLIDFIDTKRTIPYEFLLLGPTINN